jgi:hypothetical protein
VYSITLGGNVWIEAEQEISSSEDTKSIEASLKLMLSYGTSSGSVKASYQTNERSFMENSTARLRFQANGGDPTAANIIASYGDRGSDSNDFVTSLSVWLSTVAEKPQIADFKLRPVFDVSSLINLLTISNGINVFFILFASSFPMQRTRALSR